MKQKPLAPWIKYSLLPLIIGGSIVIARTSIIWFTIIGWSMLVFGAIFGYHFLLILYKKHKEKKLKEEKE